LRSRSLIDTVKRVPEENSLHGRMEEKKRKRKGWAADMRGKNRKSTSLEGFIQFHRGGHEHLKK